MRLLTFLKTGIEVLDLGLQHSAGNAWPLEYWRTNKGRWRLHTPAIDAYLNHELASNTFGEGVDDFVLYLEVADFASWGGPPAFHPPGGHVSYKPKSRALWSVAQIDWLQIQYKTLSEQYRAYCTAMESAVSQAVTYRRCPRSFQGENFAVAVALALKRGKVSTFTRAAQNR